MSKGNNMTGLTLLNIDRSLEDSQDPLKDINMLIEEIYAFLKKNPPDTVSPRLVPLRMKLRQLQDVISQFGSDGSIQVNEKQSTIMQLHGQLQMLTNNLVNYKGNYSDFSEISANYLLNHLCSTAAVDPRATVIGVSNVMAQVLSQDIQIITDSEFEVKGVDSRFFENFSLKFNRMLTIAGLFSAPVLGLPDIPISQLGSWSDQALSQFAALYRFIDEYYKPLRFYQIEKELKAVPFDTSADILSFYMYLNDFFAALIARADLLSGIEFPAEFTENGKTVILQSTAQINEILAKGIIINCDKIEAQLDAIQILFEEGIVDRNENPSNNPLLSNYRTEVKLWRMIAKFAGIMQLLFENQQDQFKLEENLRRSMLKDVMRDDDLPSIQVDASDIELELAHFIYKFYNHLLELFPQANSFEVDAFITSSDFTKFRQFFLFIIHAVAGHDIFLNLDIIWTPWLNSKFGKFYLDSTAAFNPTGALEAGILSIILGVKNKSPLIIQDGVSILNVAKQYLEFQLHNYFTIEVLTELINIGTGNIKTNVDRVTALIDKFLEEFQLSPNSLLFQRANLYKGMLTIHQMPMENEDNEDPFIMMNQRFVSFDPFSWILLPKNFKPVFPYIPLNTSLTNLNAG